MPDGQYYTVPVQGLPYKMPWSGKAPPSVSDINQFADYIASTPNHQLAAHQANAPKIPAGFDPNVVNQYRQQWFSEQADPNSIPARTLENIAGLPPEQRQAAVAASGFSPIGQAALLQEAWSQNSGQYKLPNSKYLARNLGELGVTEQQARSQGISPAVTGNKAKRQELLNRRASLQTTVVPAGQAGAGIGVDLSDAFMPHDTPQQKQQKLAAIDAQLAALGAPQAEPGVVQNRVAAPQLLPITAPLLADAIGQAMSGQIGSSEPGTYEQLPSQGFRGKLAQKLLGFTEPQALATMFAAAPFGVVGLAPFAAEAGLGAIDEAQKGDPEGALASLLAFGLPLGLHALRGKARPSVTPVTQETAPSVTPLLGTEGPFRALPPGPDAQMPPAPYGSPGTNTFQGRVAGEPARDALPPGPGPDAQMPPAPYGSPGTNTFQGRVAGEPARDALPPGPGLFYGGPDGTSFGSDPHAVQPPALDLNLLTELFGAKGAKTYTNALYKIDTGVDTNGKAQATIDKMHGKLSDSQISRLLGVEPTVTATTGEVTPTEPAEQSPVVNRDVRRIRGAIPLGGEVEPTVQETTPVAREAETFAQWVGRQPSGEIYTKASDLYKRYKAENPRATRSQFGQMFQELAVSPDHEVVTPSGNFKKSDVFTFRDSTGIERRVTGVRPRNAAAPTEVTIDHPAVQDAIVRAIEEAHGKGLTPTADQIEQSAIEQVRSSQSVPDATGPQLGTTPAATESTQSEATQSEATQTANPDRLKTSLDRIAEIDKQAKAEVRFNPELSREKAALQEIVRQDRPVLQAPEAARAQEAPSAASTETDSASVATESTATDQVTLSAKGANSLGAYFDLGDPLGEKLSDATKAVSLSPEEVRQARAVTDKLQVSYREPFAALYPPQSLHSGVNLFEEWGKLKKSGFGEKVRDAYYGDLAALTDLSKTTLHAVNNHVNSFITSKVEMDPLLPQVLAHMNPDDAARFHTYGIADQMLRVKNRLRAEIPKQQAQAKSLSDQSRALRNLRNRLRNATPIDWDKLHQVGKKTREIAQQRIVLRAAIRANEKQLASIALERATDPLTATLPNGTNVKVTEKSLKAFWGKADVAAALQAHKDLIEPLLNRNQRGQGGPTGVNLGEHTGAYFPAEALNADGSPRFGQGGARSGGRNAPNATLSANQNAREFTGTADDYAGNYAEVIRHQLERGFNRATERVMYKTLLDEGIAQYHESANPKVRYTDGKLEIEQKGKWVPGVDFEIQKSVRVTGGQRAGALDPDLPTKIVLPTDIYNELKPIFDREYQAGVDQLSNAWQSEFIRVYLMKSADLVQHGGALGSRAAYGALRAPMPLPNKVVKAVLASGQAAVNFWRGWNPNLYTPEQRLKAMKFAAPTGILPRDFGDHVGTESKIPYIGKVTGKISDWQHNTLYGDRGILSNAITGMYNEFERNGALKTPEGRDLARQAFRETFNTHGVTDHAQAAKALRSGMGMFFKTGVKNRTAAFAAGPHLYAASLAGRAAYVIGLVTLLDKKHRKPWEIPGYKWGDIPVGVDSDGRQLYFDGKLADRAGFYPDILTVRSALTAKNSRLSDSGAALTTLADFANFGLGPITSGPTAQIASAGTGIIPYVHPNQSNSGLEVGTGVKVPFGSPKYFKRLAVSALPIAGFALGENAEDDASAPQNGTVRLFNRVLPFVGLPPIRAGQPEGKVLQRTMRAQAAERKLDSKSRAR